MFNAQIIEGAQSGAGKVAKFRMITLCFKFADDSDGDDYLVLFQSSDRVGVCQQY